MTSQSNAGQRPKKARSKFRRKAKPEGGNMTLVEHLQELRRRVIIAVIALICGTIVGYIWYQNAPDFTIGSVHIHVPTLGELLREPYCNIPPEQRADFSADGTCKLLATGPFEMFLLRLKVGALAGAVFSSPIWLGQIWGFITPGLHKNEKMYTRIFVSIAVLLFTAGAMLAYYMITIGLSFLLSIGDETQTAALTGDRYYNFLLALLLIFGVSFEVPLVIIMLNAVGLLAYEQVKDKRRIIIVCVFIFAAFVTPGQDPFSMVVLAIALVLLMEMSFQYCRFNDRRRKRERPDWLDVDDDESSGAIAAPQPVAAPGAISPSADIRPAPPAQPNRPIPPAQPSPGSTSPHNYDDVL